jgi:PAS domain S-box-containing protein
MIQRARETQLALERLERAKQALQRSERKNRDLILQLEVQHTSLTAVLDRIRVGTVLVDAESRVRYVNRSCQRIVGLAKDKLLDSDWRRVMPFPEKTKAQIQAMVACPADERRRISTGFDLPDHRRYWMEIDVQDDPFQAGRHVIFLYDISEAQDLRRLIEQRGRRIGMPGESEPMRRVSRDIAELGRLDTTVLIEGETGTGKELVTRQLHLASKRNGKP